MEKNNGKRSKQNQIQLRLVFFFFFSFYLRKQIISYFYSLSIKTRPSVNNLQICIYQKFKALRTLLSRLLGRFAPIFYLNCEHVLSVYILKQRRKKFCGFKKKKNSRIFKNLNLFTKLKTLKTHFLKFLSFINLPCGHVMSHKKFGPDRFSRFDVYWVQTDKQTDRQTSQIYIQI